MIRRFSSIDQHPGTHAAIYSQEGSIILIVLMLLVMLSIIGIGSTNTSVTENQIVRNTALRKQNLHMADAAAMEVVQRVRDAGLSGDALIFNDIRSDRSGHLPWVNDMNTWPYASWYDPNFVGALLNNANSDIPMSIQNSNINLLNVRGEAANSIRYALVGWRNVTSGNLNLGMPGSIQILRTADILTEYLSQRNGIIRLTVGVRNVFPN